VYEFPVLLPHEDVADRVRAVAPDHAAYWRDLALQDFAGGPFADRSGGLITFDVASGEEAERLVADDPFLREVLLERHWLKQWMIDREEPRG
jgi:uncharacterized protein YciI